MSVRSGASRRGLVTGEIRRPNGHIRKRGRCDGVAIEVTGSTLARARELYRQREEAIRSGLDAGRMTVGQWVERWLHDHEKNSYAGTWYKYQSIVKNHVYPYAVAKEVLADVGPTEMVEHDKALVAAGTSPALRKYTRMVLTSAFRVAIARDLIVKNPYRGVRPVVATVKHHVPLSDAQYAAFARAIVGDPYELLYTLAMVIGLRQAELFGLQCGDFNVFRGELSVERQLKRKKGRGGDWEVLPVKNRTKSGAVTLPSALAARMRTFLEERGGKPGDFMFLAPRGERMNDDRFRIQFNRLLERHGIERFVFQDLRTTAVVRSMEAGNDIFATAGMVGHKNERTTMTNYARHSRRLKDVAAQRLDDAICAHLPGLNSEPKGDFSGEQTPEKPANPGAARLRSVG